jgi:hypothetical protein
VGSELLGDRARDVLREAVGRGIPGERIEGGLERLDLAARHSFGRSRLPLEVMDVGAGSPPHSIGPRAEAHQDPAIVAIAPAHAYVHVTAGRQRTIEAGEILLPDR